MVFTRARAHGRMQAYTHVENIKDNAKLEHRSVFICEPLKVYILCRNRCYDVVFGVTVAPSKPNYVNGKQGSKQVPPLQRVYDAPAFSVFFVFVAYYHLPGRCLGKSPVIMLQRKPMNAATKNPIHQAPTQAGLIGVRPALHTIFRATQIRTRVLHNPRTQFNC